MSSKHFTSFLLIAFLITSCARTVYSSDGESIYKSGKTLAGKNLFDRQKSRITLFKSCQGCHGPSGKRVSDCNIQWSYLSDPAKIEVPYTKELFFRFLDEDLKSDGSKAQTGVHWQMSDDEKSALIGYLKSLK
jgi:cytochrome c553